MVLHRKSRAPKNQLVLPKRRKLDRNPIVSEAMGVWAGFPLPVQVTLARYVQRFIRSRRIALQGNVSSGLLTILNPLRITALVKSLGRRRWYDRNRKLQSSVYLISRLDLEDRLIVAEGILRLQTYFRTRKVDLQQTSPQSLEEMVRFVFNNPHIKNY